MSAQTVRITDLNQEKNERVLACNFTIRGDMLLDFKEEYGFVHTDTKNLFCGISWHIMSQFAQQPNCSNFAKTETGKNRIKAFLIELILIYFHTCFV